jgi:hypothetical protein
MNSLLPVTGNRHGHHRHLSAQSAKSNIMRLWALGFLLMNFLIGVAVSRQNRL